MVRLGTSSSSFPCRWVRAVRMLLCRNIVCPRAGNVSNTRGELWLAGMNSSRREVGVGMLLSLTPGVDSVLFFKTSYIVWMYIRLLLRWICSGIYFWSSCCLPGNNFNLALCVVLRSMSDERGKRAQITQSIAIFLVRGGSRLTTRPVGIVSVGH